MLLSEILEFIFEGAREDFVIKQMGSKIIAKYKADTKQEETAENIVDQLSQKADPTANKQYLQWIARMYVNNQFRWEDLIRVKENLQRFEQVKSKLANKDLNSYKSLADVVRAIEPFADQEIISGKQAVKKGVMRYDINSPEAKRFFETGEAELFYRGSTLNVVIPLTQEASCFFGMNTEWCTARNDEENRFGEYNENGRLYIINCKDGSRYQFHFETQQFMDKYDSVVNMVELVEKYPELKDAFDDVAMEMLFLPLIKNQTESLYLAAVQQNGYALEFVNKQTESLCLAAVQQNGYALRYVKKQTEAICLTAVQQNGYALEFVKKQTPEICLTAVQHNGYALRYVKEQTPEICLVAVERIGFALRYVKKQTPEICLTAVQQNWLALKYVNDPTMKRYINDKLGL